MRIFGLRWIDLYVEVSDINIGLRFRSITDLNEITKICDVYRRIAVFNTPLVLQIWFRSLSQLQCLRPHFLCFQHLHLSDNTEEFHKRRKRISFFLPNLATQPMSLAEDSKLQYLLQKLCHHFQCI